MNEILLHLIAPWLPVHVRRLVGLQSPKSPTQICVKVFRYQTVGFDDGVPGRVQRWNQARLLKVPSLIPQLGHALHRRE